MNLYEINVQEPYFSFLKNGVKTMEIRLNKNKFKEMKAGDKILMNESVNLEVVGKKEYRSFRELFEAEGLEKSVPDAQSIDEAVNICYKFYSKEDEVTYGVVTVYVKLV